MPERAKFGPGRLKHLAAWVICGKPTLQAKLRPEGQRRRAFGIESYPEHVSDIAHEVTAVGFERESALLQRPKEPVSIALDRTAGPGPELNDRIPSIVLKKAVEAAPLA